MKPFGYVVFWFGVLCLVESVIPPEAREHWPVWRDAVLGFCGSVIFTFGFALIRESREH